MKEIMKFLFSGLRKHNIHTLLSAPLLTLSGPVLGEKKNKTLQIEFSFLPNNTMRGVADYKIIFTLI